MKKGEYFTGKRSGMWLFILATGIIALLPNHGCCQERFVHDPFIIKEGAYYYLVCTGHNIKYRRSTDLFHWMPIGYQGSIYAQPPKWAQDVLRRRPKSANPEPNMWGGQIFFFNGKYHLYSNAAVWGINDVAMGLATNVTLDPDNPQYKWEDQGIVLQTTPMVDDFAALGGMINADQEGNYWLVYGGWQLGAMLQRLDAHTGKPSTKDRKVYNLAARRDPSLKYRLGPGIEGPFLYRQNGYWYLFISFDNCCKGSDSTYNIRVGRSKDIRGPYRDRSGKPMLEGGGTLVLRSYDNVRGPGSNQIIVDNGNEYHVSHWYDSSHNGVPTLSVRPVVWDEEGWPLLGEMIDGPVQDIKKLDPDTLKKSIPGEWSQSADFGPSTKFTYLPDGTINGMNATWELEGHKLKLRSLNANAPNGTWTLDCTISEDGTWYVCRSGSGDGIIVRGRRIDGKERRAPISPEKNPLLAMTPVEKSNDTATVAENNIREGLILHYTFDQTVNGGTISDLSGSGNSGMASQVHWIERGRKGGALEFTTDGNSHIRVPNKSVFQTAKITLAVWVKGIRPGPGWRRIIDKSFDQGFALSVAGFLPDARLRGKALFEIGPDHWIVSDNPIIDGQWHHLAASYDGEEQRLYVDGVIQKHVAKWAGRIPSNSYDIAIGANRSTPAQQFGRAFMGAMDEVMIFNRALMPGEIRELYETQAASQYPKVPGVQATTPSSAFNSGYKRGQNTKTAEEEAAFDSGSSGLPYDGGYEWIKKTLAPIGSYLQIKDIRNYISMAQLRKYDASSFIEWIKREFRSSKPTPEPSRRDMLFQALDIAAAMNSADLNGPLGEYWIEATAATVEQLQSTPPPNVLSVHKMYNEGVVLRTSDVCLGIDIVLHPNTPTKIVDALAGCLDVLLITHLHMDHYDANLIERLKSAGKPVIVAYEMQTVPTGGFLFSGEIKGAQWNAYSGTHWDPKLFSAFYVIRIGDWKILHSGDNNAWIPAFLRSEDARKLDLLLIKMERPELALSLRPRFCIPHHLLELNHIMEAYGHSQMGIEKRSQVAKETAFLMLQWGERFEIPANIK